MAGPEERGGRGAGGSGEAQTQGQPRDSAMAPVQPSLGPPRDEPRVFGLDKFNGDNFAEWSFKLENIFDHYDLLEVMEGTEKRPENDAENSPWVRKSAQGYLLLGQALGSSQIRHIKPFQREPEKGPKAWAALKGVHAPATAAVAVVLERQMAALRIEEDEAVEEGVQKFFDLLTRLEGADLNYKPLTQGFCMALVPKHLRHNKLGAKAIWAVHLGMAQNSKRWLLWDPFTKKFLVSRDCKFMENLMYKDWKAENEAKIGMRFGEVKSSGLEHVELPLELSSSSTTTRQSSLVNGGEEAKDAEEEEEEVQQVSERAPTLPSRTTSAPRIRVTPQQRQGLHVPAAEEEGRGKSRIQAPNRLTYDALGKPAKSALVGAALMVGEDEESDYEECAFALFSPVEMPGEPATLKEALESSDAEEWKKAMETELKSIEENGTWELVELPEGRKCVKGPEEESVVEEERRRFHSLVGSLMYAAVNTRPDVAFATGQLARVVQCPNEELVAAGMRVAKYLGQTPTVGLQYSAAAQRRQKGADGVEPGRLFLTAFSDASYACKPEDMTSVGGFISCVGGGPTAWESKKQVDQALSSVESENMALFRAVREIVWQRRLLAELGEEQQGPTPLYCDSQGAIALAKNPVLHGLTKHMRVKWHWTRSIVAAGEVELHYVKTTRQPADMMTKRLVEQQHCKCCKLAGMALN
ncbi:unnamed protein product [Closterium sp. NIES-53]